MSTHYLIGFTTLKVDPSVSNSLSLLAFLHYCLLLVHLHFCLQFIIFRIYFTYVFTNFIFNLISLCLSLYFLLLIRSPFIIHSIQKWPVLFPFCSVHQYLYFISHWQVTALPFSTQSLYLPAFVTYNLSIYSDNGSSRIL